MILIGYSGHAYVVCGILHAAGRTVTGYCDMIEKDNNPFNLIYLGNEKDPASLEALREQGFFISVGDNKARKKIYDHFDGLKLFPGNAIHPSAVIDHTVNVEPHGVMISAGVCINPLSVIGLGAICNTGAIIEHECRVGNFAHIGPGAVLCGNVTIGDHTFVGAGAVIRQGVTVGNNVVIGAGAVVVKDIENDQVVIGNPSRLLIK